MSDNTYTCEACGSVFEKGWTDDEAAAERTANGWDGTDCGLTCDPCYKLLMARRTASAQALNMTPEQLDVHVGAEAQVWRESMEQWQNAVLTEWAAVLQVPVKYLINSKEETK
jgi:hypothetical protein